MGSGVVRPPFPSLSEAVVRYVRAQNNIELRNVKTPASYQERADAYIDLITHARLLDRGRSERAHIEAMEFDPL